MRVGVLATALLSACAAPVAPSCEVDAVCPEELPYTGAPCVDGLSCRYSALVGPGCDGTARCEGGQWRALTACLVAPQLAETCRAPVTTPLAGATLAFVEAPGPLEWGAQGSAMVRFTIEVAPEETAPACVSVRSRVQLDAEMDETTVPIQLRCGRSRTIYVVLPGMPCEDRDYALVLDVDVTGVGTLHHEAMVRGGGGRLCTIP
jgi:hypothetical protein